MVKVIKSEYFIYDNQLYSWRDPSHHLNEHACTLTVDNHTLHYGDGVFEGIRAYRADNGTLADQTARYVVDLEGHLDRMFGGIQTLYLGFNDAICYTDRQEFHIRITREQFKEQILDAIALNFPDGEDSIYIRPIVFRGQGLAVNPADRRPHYAIVVQRWEDYVSGHGMLLSERMRLANGVDYSQTAFKGFDPYNKISGDYVRGVIAKGKAASARTLDGKDPGISEPAFLNLLYNLAEASGAVIFLFKDGQLFTPRLWDGVLDSRTRRIVMGMYPGVIEKTITLKEFLEADEVFLAGTAAEITRVKNLYIPLHLAREYAGMGILPDEHFNKGIQRLLPVQYHYTSGKKEDDQLLAYALDSKSKGEVERLAGTYQDIVRARRMGDFRHLLTRVPDGPSMWAIEHQQREKKRVDEMAKRRTQMVAAGPAQK